MIPLRDYPSQNNTLGLIIFILFWVGVALGVMIIFLFKSIALPFSWALIIWIAPGVILTPFLYNAVPSQKLKGFSKAFVLLFANIVAFGGILLYAVLAIDFYGAKGNNMAKGDYKVVETGIAKYKNGGEQRPVAAIIYNGQEKWFPFSDNLTSDTLIYRRVQLETTPGLLGFDVIKSWKLIK
jgi:hypothetical protein